MLEAVGLSVAIEMMGQFAIFAVVLLEIRVKQQNRNSIPMRTGVNIEPGSDPTGRCSICSATIASSGVQNCADCHQSGCSTWRSSESISWRIPGTAHERNEDDGYFQIGED